MTMNRVSVIAASAALIWAAGTAGCSLRSPGPNLPRAVWWECAAVELNLSGIIVLIDPWFPFGRKADAVLVTHLHYDHFSPETIARIQDASGERLGLIVGPAQIAAPLRTIGKGKERIARAGETIRFQNLVIETVFSSENNRDDLGYLIRDTKSGLTILHLGDNHAYSDECARVKDIDYLFLSMGKMPLEDMLRLLQTVRPRFLIPIHYKPAKGAFQAEFYPSPPDPETYLDELARAMKARRIETEMLVLIPGREVPLRPR